MSHTDGLVFIGPAGDRHTFEARLARAIIASVAVAAVAGCAYPTALRSGRG